jgi:hypothetical protein
MARYASSLHQPNDERWECYGGATPPVLICPEWMTFKGFLASMGKRPEGTTLGRLLDTGNYEPGNAFWMTTAEQSLNKRNRFNIRKWTSTSALCVAA